MECLLKYRVLGPTPWVSNPKGKRWGEGEGGWESAFLTSSLEMLTWLLCPRSPASEYSALRLHVSITHAVEQYAPKFKAINAMHAYSEASPVIDRFSVEAAGMAGPCWPLDLYPVLPPSPVLCPNGPPNSKVFSTFTSLHMLFCLIRILFPTSLFHPSKLSSDAIFLSTTLP